MIDCYCDSLPGHKIRGRLAGLSEENDGWL